MKYIPLPNLNVIITSSILLIISACNILGDENNEDPKELLRTWELVELSDAEGNEITLIEGDFHTARFSRDGTMGGETSCNFYGGDFNADRDGDISIKNLVSTDIACEEPNNSEEFLNALAQSKSYGIESGILVLTYGPDGRLEFQERLE